jgi:hypothetical protein
MESEPLVDDTASPGVPLRVRAATRATYVAFISCGFAMATSRASAARVRAARAVGSRSASAQPWPVSAAVNDVTTTAIAPSRPHEGRPVAGTHAVILPAG